ncbi:phytoene/squalene synthase family protein [Candidatus Saccharibacteria bacterium]|nr:phytoene/squalene synthase family protein [Candidatus Saccharibacteria bacterium]
MSSLERDIFKRGSTTHYFSSKFFPKAIRTDVFKLYSFVRVADDYVDSVPQNKKEFKILRAILENAIDEPEFDTAYHKTDSLNERVVKNIIHVAQKYDFEHEWLAAFLDSMQADIDKKIYTSLDGSLWYTYGSAEVIGLMMAKIMGMPDKALEYAALQGRALQWINFIRDIDEDNKLGRCYFPKEDLARFELSDLKAKTAKANPINFKKFISFQLGRYKQWQKEAEKGFEYIPKRLRIPIETAVDNYNWTASQIANSPTVVYEKKIKPTQTKVLIMGLKRVTIGR